MNIFDFFKKLRGSNSVVTESLVLPSTLANIPTDRGRLDDEKIAKLEKIKEEFLKILSQKKYFSSHDLTSKYFSEDILMNTNLFGKIVIDHDDVYNPDVVTSLEKAELYIHQVVNPRKIELYINAINEMYTDTYLRLIALKEIFLEKGEELSKNKREAIINEVSNLTNNYVIVESSFYAAMKEAETYKKEYEIIKYNESDSVTKEYHNRVIKMAKFLIPDEVAKIEDKKLTVYDEIAHIERELEIYAYKNIKVEELNKELEELDSVPKVAKNKPELLRWINELEVSYIVLDEYGKYELDLKPLYEIKFDILTIDAINEEYSPFDEDIDSKEFKYYEDIIADKIVTNITGIDSLFSRWALNYQELIPSIVSRLKGESGNIRNKFNYKEILKSNLLLCMILYMESREKTEYFFNHFMLDCYGYDNGTRFKEARKHESIAKAAHPIYFEDRTRLVTMESGKVPFSTVCRFTPEKKPRNYDDEDFGFIYHSLFFEESDEIKLPEGIKNLLLDYYAPLKWSKWSWSEREYYNICDFINNKTLVMPSTLKEIQCRNYIMNMLADDNLKIPKLILNEGLEKIIDYNKNDFNFKKIGVESITIPSTLVDCKDESNYFSCDNFKDIPEIIFSNFESSKLFGDNYLNSLLWAKVDAAYLDVMDNLPATCRISEKSLVKEKTYQELNLKTNRIVLTSHGIEYLAIDIAAIAKEYILSMLRKYLDDASDDMLLIRAYLSDEEIAKPIKQLIYDYCWDMLHRKYQVYDVRAEQIYFAENLMQDTEHHLYKR